MRRVLALTALTAALAAGCGGDEGDERPVVVSAAASLQTAFKQYGETLGDPAPRFSFAGSDELAAQIRQGVRPDVFAAANTKLPDELFAAGLVERPVVFAGNRLVLAVPAEGGDVDALADVAREGVKVVIGSESVPVGAYTLKVLGDLPAGEREAILGNVRSEEPDVKGIVGKLTQGAADAGFVYVTDVEAANGELRAIDLPDDLEPSVAYGVTIVKGARNPEAARRFVDGLLAGDGRAALDSAGFLPPPQ
jgi:molybdate transport system substrate-binding protein